MEIGSPRELKHLVLKALSFKPPRSLAWTLSSFCLASRLDIYSLIIGLPRIRRELSAGETRACSLIVLLSLLVLGFNVTKDTHPQIASWLVLILGIIGFQVVRLVARMRMRQSG